MPAGSSLSLPEDHYHDRVEGVFLGEVGAAAALAGLLFVSVSVNQQRILALGRMADRGADALILLFLALTAASLPLIPGQSPRLLGAEITGVRLVAALAMLRLQRSYLRDLEPSCRRQSIGLLWLNRFAVAAIVTGGLLAQGGETPASMWWPKEFS